MDPASTVALVSSIIGIADAVLRGANRLSVLKTKYRQADTSVSLLLGQMCTIQAALRQLSHLKSPDLTSLTSVGPDWLNGLSTSMDGCAMLIALLDEQIDQLERREDGDLNKRGKTLLLWQDTQTKDYLDMLDRYVNALNLLLLAAQCTSTERSSAMKDEDSMTVLRLARETTGSLYAFDDTSTRLDRKSKFSQNTDTLSMQFDFDCDVMGSRAYQTAFRSNLRDIIRAKPNTQGNSEVKDYKQAFLDQLESFEQDCIQRSNEISANVSDSSGESSRGLVVGEATRTLESRSPGSVPWLSRHFLALKRLKLPFSHGRGLPDSRPKEQMPSASSILLGISESGKSTLLKSFRLATQGGYSSSIHHSFKEIIFSNMVQSMRVLLEATESLELPLQDRRMEYHVQTIFMQPAYVEWDTLPQEVAIAIKSLWADKGVQESYARREEFQLAQGAAYYFQSIDRLSASDYEPTDKDLLVSRVKTTGVTVTDFDIPTEMSYDGSFRQAVFDVGGVRSERKKWIHAVPNQHLIFFTVDCCCWNRMLFEEQPANRMQEALALWDSVVNSRWFVRTAFVLLFTHADQLTPMLDQHKPGTWFQGYDGDSSVETFKIYLEKRFLSLAKRQNQVDKILWVNLVDDSAAVGKKILETGIRSIYQRQGKSLSSQDSLYE